MPLWFDMWWRYISYKCYGARLKGWKILGQWLLSELRINYCCVACL
jgi:hypothetical protein